MSKIRVNTGNSKVVNETLFIDLIKLNSLKKKQRENVNDGSSIEDHKPVNQSTVEWELDDYQLQQLEKLGLSDTKNEDDYISRI